MPTENFSRRIFLKLAGLSLTGGFLAACMPDSTGVPSLPKDLAPLVTTTTTQPKTATPLPASPTLPPASPTTPLTSTPSPTVSPTQTPTSIPVLPTQNPEVLTKNQQDRLAAAALKFQADNEPDAILVARSLGYLVNDGHPASVCGPLSVAILREAELVSQYVDLHEFWLLNPRDGNSILEKTFPKEDFTWFRTEESITTFNFRELPLKAGDFLYLYAGDPGSFEHMLTVSRVDLSGRAFSVTNFDTQDGFKIEEVMLYDPNQPGVGKFYDWTDRKNARIGMTGFGGFLLLRFRSKVQDKSDLEKKYEQEIDKVLENAGGTWRIFIKEIGGPVFYARQERRTIHPASVIKVPIAMLFFNSLEKMGVEDYTVYLTKGYDGRTYKQLLRSMLVNSEEEAADSLEKVLIENRLDISKVLASWGASHTFLSVRQSTAMEMAVLFEGLYLGHCVGKTPQEIILNYLQFYTPGDDLRLGEIRKFLPPGYSFYNKRGTITDGFLVVADTAVVQIPTPIGDKAYVLAAFGYQGENHTNYSQLEYALGRIAVLLWQYSQAL